MAFCKENEFRLVTKLENVVDLSRSKSPSEECGSLGSEKSADDPN